MEAGGGDAGAEELEAAEPEEGENEGAAPDAVRLAVRGLPPRLEDGIVFGARRPAGAVSLLGEDARLAGLVPGDDVVGLGRRAGDFHAG